VDIVVTIPKSEYDNDDAETRFLLLNPDYYQFWTLSKVPNKLNIGDRIYFVKRNKIDSSMEVFDIKIDQEEHCDVTDRNWHGKCLVYFKEIREENINVEVKGFQGFRYKWW
jgi:phage terminase large subunit-like protein